MWHTYVNVACNILLLSCVWFNYRRASQSFDLLCEAQAKERAAQSELRIAQMKLESEVLCSAMYRGQARGWADNYRKLWAETHLGSDVISGESGYEDDGRS